MDYAGVVTLEILYMIAFLVRLQAELRRAACGKPNRTSPALAA